MQKRKKVSEWLYCLTSQYRALLYAAVRIEDLSHFLLRLLLRQHADEELAILGDRLLRRLVLTVGRLHLHGAIHLQWKLHLL